MESDSFDELSDWEIAYEIGNEVLDQQVIRFIQLGALALLIAIIIRFTIAVSMVI